MKPSLAQAQHVIAAALVDARREGYMQALLAVERAVYSSENLEELLVWLSTERRGDPSAP